MEIVEHMENGVKVKTQDGFVYQGDFIVGADGVHSRVRQEMARHACEIGVGEQLSKENGRCANFYWQSDICIHISYLDVPSSYCCLFGISKSVQGVSGGTLEYVMNKGFSYIVGSGPENRTYWALMKNLGKTYHGEDIPRFGFKDEKRIIEEHWNDRIGPEISFSDLYNNPLRPTVLRPMREFTYSKWFLHRMLIIGDAAHQVRKSEVLKPILVTL